MLDSGNRHDLPNWFSAQGLGPEERNLVARTVGCIEIVVSIHLPTLDIEMAMGPTIQAGAIDFFVPLEWPGHLSMPASKNPD
jgi:hypothetical protein